ncbi:MAG TPA: ubiquinone/menaquinone biosynthesis methyltransferase [bacterium]|nr:ubiquinone/menaquinone biosynthesis methyltransferase [bacterium]
MSSGRSFTSFNNPAPERSVYVREMFDRIARWYDFLNAALSLGVVYVWRARLLREAECPRGGSVVDLCTGTGKVLEGFLKRSGIASGVGIDLSPGMLRVAAEKARKEGNAGRLRYVNALAEKPPVRDGAFDRATIAFGLRNVRDVEQVFRAMAASVREGGKVIALELTLPRNSFLQGLYRRYLRALLPLVGGAVTGNRDAYDYLTETILAIPESGVIAGMMARAGLRNVRIIPLAFGSATLFIGEK